MKKIIVLILAIALGTRGAVALFSSFYGIHSVWFLPNANAWTDFGDIYGGQLKLLGEGFLPYRDFAYSYPPLFLYTLYPFYVIGGVSFAAVPIFLADATTAVVIYLLGSKFRPGVALIGALAYALSPFALFNEGYLWLSSQPFTFFALLSLLLLKEQKGTLGIIALAVAILFKQQAIAILPIFILFSIRSPTRHFRKDVALFVVVIVSILLPFLVLAPSQLIASLSFGITSRNAGLTLPSYTNGGSVMTQSCAESSVNNIVNSIAICGNATVNAPQLAYLELTLQLQAIAQILAPAILLIMIPALAVSMKHEGALQLTAAYANAGFLVLFSTFVHPALGYYLLPTFALLYSSSSDVPTLAVAVLAPIAILLVPDGVIQLLVTLLALLVVLVIMDVNKRATQLLP